MAQLELVKDNMSVLDDIEKQAEGYTVLNTLANIVFQVGGIYMIDQLSVNIARMLGCPC